MKSRLGIVDRIVAIVLALVWAIGGVAGLIAGWIQQRWLMGLAGAGALVFAVLWLRVAVRGRLLSRPSRAHAPHSR